MPFLTVVTIFVLSSLMYWLFLVLPGWLFWIGFMLIGLCGLVSNAKACSEKGGIIGVAGKAVLLAAYLTIFAFVLIVVLLFNSVVVV